MAGPRELDKEALQTWQRLHADLAGAELIEVHSLYLNLCSLILLLRLMRKSCCPCPEGKFVAYHESRVSVRGYSDLCLNIPVCVEKVPPGGALPLACHIVLMRGSATLTSADHASVRSTPVARPGLPSAPSHLVVRALLQAQLSPPCLASAGDKLLSCDP